MNDTKNLWKNVLENIAKNYSQSIKAEIKEAQTTTELERAVLECAEIYGLSLDGPRYWGETYAGVAKVLLSRAFDIEQRFGVGGRFTNVVVNTECLADHMEDAELRWHELEEAQTVRNSTIGLKIEIKIGRDTLGDVNTEADNIRYREAVKKEVEKRYCNADISVELAEHSSVWTNADDLIAWLPPEYLYYMAVEENCREVISLVWDRGSW